MEVEFFDSLEAAEARLRQAMEAADARVRPWQAAVKVGGCFIADGGEEDLVVFGEVLEGYQEAHLRHYRFCRCFSVACPEGELGDVHVSTILAVVSRAFFEAMRQAGWQMEAGQRPRSSCRMDEGGRSAAIKGSPQPAATRPAPALVQCEPPRQITRARGSTHNSRLRSSTAGATPARSEIKGLRQQAAEVIWHERLKPCSGQARPGDGSGTLAANGRRGGSAGGRLIGPRAADVPALPAEARDHGLLRAGQEGHRGPSASPREAAYPQQAPVRRLQGLLHRGPGWPRMPLVGPVLAGPGVP